MSTLPGEDLSTTSLDHARLILDNRHSSTLWDTELFEAEFPVIFASLLNLYLCGQDRTSAIDALLCCFGRLDKFYVRMECLRLVSLGCWCSLSDARREAEFEKQPRLAQVWPKAKDLPFGGFFGRIIEDCVGEGSGSIVDLLKYCLLQWPTRRYLAVLLDDRAFVARCRSMNYTFVDCFEYVLCSSHTFDPSSEQADWTREDYEEDLYERIEDFQLSLTEQGHKSPLLYSPFHKFTDRKECQEMLTSHLTEQTAVSSVCEKLHWKNEFTIERLCDYFHLFPDTVNEVVSDPAPDLKDIISLDSMKEQLCPLTLQFLNQCDYLIRMYKLLKYEFTLSLQEHLNASLLRSKPALDKSLSVVFDGWSRYSAQCKHVDNSIYQISLCPSASELVVNEWQRLKLADFVYLCRVVAGKDGGFVFERIQATQLVGFVKEQNQQIRPANMITENKSRDSSPKLLFSFDVDSFKDVNFVLRLDPKDNSIAFMRNIKKILQSPKISLKIPSDALFYGRQTESKTVSSMADWHDSGAGALVVSGPASSGKTTMLMDLLKMCRAACKVLVLVPTSESADFLTEQLFSRNAIDGSSFVRMGHSPRNIAFGRVDWHLKLREQLLLDIDQYLAGIGVESPAVLSCEAALLCLEQVSEPDEQSAVFVEKLRKMVPLEFIQSGEHRESYLFKYASSVALMTYGYAAIHADMLAACHADLILMEDSHLVPELLCTLPLFSMHTGANKTSRVVLFGNEEVEPVSNEPLLLEYNYGASLFHRLVRLDVFPRIALSTIHNLPAACSHLFKYNVSPNECVLECVQVESESVQDAMHSKQNVLEAEELVDYFISNFSDSPETSQSVVILAPFNSQVDLLRDVLADRQIANPPPVYSVDKFSSACADIVLCSMALPKMTLFLQKRLSIIMTRARKHLVLFHSPLYSPLSI